MTSPTAEYVAGNAVLTRVSCGFWMAVTVAVVGRRGHGAVAGLAVFVTEPASRSACVIVWLAVQVIEARGAKLAVARAGPVALSSATVNGPLSVTFPLLVTR